MSISIGHKGSLNDFMSMKMVCYVVWPQQSPDHNPVVNLGRILD